MDVIRFYKKDFLGDFAIMDVLMYVYRIFKCEVFSIQEVDSKFFEVSLIIKGLRN